MTCIEIFSLKYVSFDNILKYVLVLKREQRLKHLKNNAWLLRFLFVTFEGKNRRDLSHPILWTCICASPWSLSPFSLLGGIGLCLLYSPKGNWFSFLLLPDLSEVRKGPHTGDPRQWASHRRGQEWETEWFTVLFSLSQGGDVFLVCKTCWGCQ